MTIITELDQAIHFIEQHLLEPITYEDVAKHLNMSNYHFHRTFSLIVGITPAEYIRKRRLSTAGQEIVLTDQKIIDLAYKYLYETPESFTKAFTRFHGVTPSNAKKSGYQLKLFNPLIIKLTIEGGIALDYRIEKKEPFTLLTKNKTFNNTIISDDTNTEIPDFWAQCGNNKVFDILSKTSNTSDVYGICAPISKESTSFNYGIGMLFEKGEVPTDFELWEVKNPLWAVFKCLGENGDCIGETWNRIFTEFLPSSPYKMIDSSDFELYSDKLEADCFCEIWIPVEKIEVINED